MDPAFEVLFPDGRLVKIFFDGSITGAAEGTHVIMNRVWPTMTSCGESYCHHCLASSKMLPPLAKIDTFASFSVDPIGAAC